MRILPIVERELRIAARRRSAFWVRLAAASVAVATGAIQLWVFADWGASRSLGREIFEGLSLLALGFCLASGPLFTADVLSEEKREGTLGLLFLTDLRAHDVVLGKLAAAAVPGVFALLAVVPVVALSLLLGGVSLQEFGRMLVVLGNALCFSLATGMAMSALCQEARSAFALTGFLLFLAAAVAPWIVASLSGAAPPSVTLMVAAALSPLGGFFTAPDTRYAAEPFSYWLCVTMTQVEAWLLLGVANRFTGRAWRESTAFRIPERWQRWWLGVVLGRAGQRQKLRQLLDRNPLLWLASRQRLKRSLLWGFFGVALTIWLASRTASSWTWWSVGTVTLVAFLLQASLKWLVASEAALRFAEDRRSGALELLLTSGLDVPDLVRGQMLAMRRLFGVPALALLGVEAILLVASGPALERDRSWLLAVVAMALFVWDLPTLAWGSMWYSVSGRRPQWASLRAIGRVLVLPWLILLAVLFVIGVWSWVEVAVVWLVVCGLNNHLVRTFARQQLLAQFREAAAVPGRAARPAAIVPAKTPGLAAAPAI